MTPWTGVFIHNASVARHRLTCTTTKVLPKPCQNIYWSTRVLAKFIPFFDVTSGHFLETYHKWNNDSQVSHLVVLFSKRFSRIPEYCMDVFILVTKSSREDRSFSISLKRFHQYVKILSTHLFVCKINSSIPIHFTNCIHSQFSTQNLFCTVAHYSTKTLIQSSCSRCACHIFRRSVFFFVYINIKIPFRSVNLTKLSDEYS